MSMGAGQSRSSSLHQPFLCPWHCPSFSCLVAISVDARVWEREERVVYFFVFFFLTILQPCEMQKWACQLNRAASEWATCSTYLSISLSLFVPLYSSETSLSCSFHALSFSPFSRSRSPAPCLPSGVLTLSHMHHSVLAHTLLHTCIRTTISLISCTKYATHHSARLCSGM